MASSVTFPLSESPQKQSKISTPSRPHLPFRRISLPTATSFTQRESVFSIVSVESLPEDDEKPLSSRVPVVKGNGRNQPVSIESPRKRKRTRGEFTTKPPDDKLSMKRKKIVDEFYETEVSYVDGLDLIYGHFLTPIIDSLEGSEPLLNRSALASIFSNFIDIWNFHKSFLLALAELLKQNPEPSNSVTPPPNISSLLLAHFPYLSLYTPFITLFTSTVSTLTELVTPPSSLRPNPLYNAKFADFLKTQEADPRCGKLKLRDWLLTIVQRCPRYLLLLKDLINNTEKENLEHAQLATVHTLVGKITSSLNESLHAHAQTLSLLALQRATPNLPFHLVSPGRNLIKRGTLIQVDRIHGPIDREFLLFSDYLIWLAPAGDSSWGWSGSGPSQSSQNIIQPPVMLRSRSKSDAYLATMNKSQGDGGPSPSTPSSPSKVWRRRSHYHLQPPPPAPPSTGKRHPSGDDKWIYKGHIGLVDIEVVVGSDLEGDRRFEILSPVDSFAVYAASEKERDEWTSEIRASKQQLFISLSAMNPNSTLTSSSSTNHVRRVLQALPYPPSDERLMTMKASSSMDLFFNSSSTPLSRFGKFGGKKEKGKDAVERRRKVDHWLPPVWIPDSKTSACMRCGRMFGWRRRRHHCRLCGRCVCSACSGRTFFIAEINTKSGQSNKSARACETCFETVFPVVDPTESMVYEYPKEHQRHNSDTITSLALPSWVSMPALPVQRQPQALMAIDLNSSYDLSSMAGGIQSIIEDKERKPRISFKSHNKFRSSQQILVDFQEAGQENAQGEGVEDSTLADSDVDDESFEDDDVFFSPLQSFPQSPLRKEDTARRSKRLSLPAVALHATSVTARMTETVGSVSAVDEHTGPGGSVLPNGISFSPARPQRFSLVHAGRSNRHFEDNKSDGDLGKGVAAVTLAELLKKSKVS